MKAETTIGPGQIMARPDRKYVGIRFVCPFPGMFAIVAREWKILRKFSIANSLEDSHRYFLRYYHCDMEELMDLEIGLFCESFPKVSGPINTGVLPGGRYASLVYRGNGLRGNQALMKWAREENLEFERLDPAKRESYVSRYEAYLADTRIETRKLLWDVEVAIKTV